MRNKRERHSDKERGVKSKVWVERNPENESKRRPHLASQLCSFLEEKRRVRCLNNIITSEKMKKKKTQT